MRTMNISKNDNLLKHAQSKFMLQQVSLQSKVQRRIGLSQFLFKIYALSNH